MYTEAGLVRIAKRENNPKRNYLVVNRLQGKHIPVSPTKAFEMFDALAGQLKRAYPKETLLIIGFAETATAIGARLAAQTDSYYMQTTREQIPNVEYIYFSETHSHATEQKLVCNDLERLIGKIDRIVFAEDEVTTGNTILHMIQKLEERFPLKTRFSVASLLNGMDAEARERFAAKGIDLHFLVKTDHASYAEKAERFAEDGTYVLAKAGNLYASKQYVAGNYVNARRQTAGAAYTKACESLWTQIKDHIVEAASQDILMLGTEECMYPALYVGECLERLGNRVSCHATTRSPIAVSSENEYPLHTRYELESVYQDGRRTFLYDLRQYDKVILVTDAPQTQTKGIGTLVDALARCGNREIQIIWWR